MSILYNGECYLRDQTDCNDSDFWIHPHHDANGEELAYEILDGADNDCDGEIPVVELDCDDDNYMAISTGAVSFNQAFVDEEEFGTPTSLLIGDGTMWPCWGNDDGLADYADEVWTQTHETQLECWGQDLDISCDEDTGLWVMKLAVAEDMFDHSKRTPAPINIGDCDDNCSERYPDYSEICDGLDNDCNAAEFLDEYDYDSAPTNIPGVPDTMEIDLDHEGWVSSSEMDLDADGYIGCTDRPTGQQEYISVLSCLDTPPEGGDCNSLCGLSFPDAEEVCNGFTDVCDDVGEGTDSDKDDHKSCGAFSGDDSMAEHIYVLAHVDPDPTATGEYDRKKVVPFVLPREAAAECDARLLRQLELLLGEETVEHMLDGLTLEPALEFCITSHLCDKGVLSGDDCEGTVEGGGCVVLRMELAEDQDGSLTSLKQGDACHEHPEQLITRTVWNHNRIINTRQLVAWWECYRVYGTYGCADLTEPDEWWAMPDEIVVGGRSWHGADEFDDAVTTGVDGWHELDRYTPEIVDAVMAGCWEDDVSTALAQIRPPSDPVAFNYTGGDCSEGDSSANRDLSEGPDDLVGSFFDYERDCRSCLDGIDNNCNGLTDCEDPACADCFIGQGVGCGASGSACSDSGCSATGTRTRTAGNAVLMALLGLVAMARLRRRAR